MSDSRQSPPPLRPQSAPATTSATTPTSTRPAVPEPECIGICNPEPLSGKCEGCGRQLQPPAEFGD